MSWELEESCLESPLEPAEEGGSADLHFRPRLQHCDNKFSMFQPCRLWGLVPEVQDVSTGYPGADTEGAGSLSSVVECLWKAEVSDLAKRQESWMDFSI